MRPLKSQYKKTGALLRPLEFSLGLLCALQAVSINQISLADRILHLKTVLPA